MKQKRCMEQNGNKSLRQICPLVFFMIWFAFLDRKWLVFFFQKVFNGFLVELWSKNFGDQDDIELQNDTGGEGRVAHLMYGAAWRR